MNPVANKLSFEEFLNLPQSDDRYELVDGELVPKMTPTTPHSRVQKRILRLIDDWCDSTGIGEVNPEWAVALKRRGVDWSPVPDLTYIPFDRVPPKLGWRRSLPWNPNACSRNYFPFVNIRRNDPEGY